MIIINKSSIKTQIPKNKFSSGSHAPNIANIRICPRHLIKICGSHENALSKIKIGKNMARIWTGVKSAINVNRLISSYW